MGLENSRLILDIWMLKLLNVTFFYGNKLDIYTLILLVFFLLMFFWGLYKYYEIFKKKHLRNKMLRNYPDGFWYLGEYYPPGNSGNGNSVVQSAPTIDSRILADTLGISDSAALDFDVNDIGFGEGGFDGDIGGGEGDSCD